MAALKAAYQRLRDEFRTHSGVAAELASGAGLWALVVGFCVWAFLQERDAFVVGVVTGSVFALGAIGLTLIYGVLKFGHFAHGDSMMLGAYVAFFLLTGVTIGKRPGLDTEALPVGLNDLPGATSEIWHFSFGYGLLLAMVIAAVLMALLFMGLEYGVYRPLRRRKSGIVIFSIASLGLALVIRSLMLIVWGADQRSYSQGLRSTIDLPFGILIRYDQLFILGVAFVVVALVYLLLFRTKLGKAMRAMADNPDLALISGINTNQIVVWTWAIAGALVAVAGVMLALQAQLDPQLGFVILLPLFAGAIAGGIGSPQGALVGGFLIGIVQEVAVTFDFLSPGYKFSVAFVVLILILLVRPRGLFGTKV